MPTVLLIEDDVESRKRLARLFARHGWDVIEALEGKAGIELAFAKRDVEALAEARRLRVTSAREVA